METRLAVGLVVDRLVTRLRVRLTPGPLQATLSKKLCAQANSASYPRRDGKPVVVHLLWDTG